MERFAANYLYLPDYGFLKQCVVEREEHTIHIFPLKEEIEAVVWIPGIICLLGEIGKPLEQNIFLNNNITTEIPVALILNNLTIVQLYPFNFSTMQPQDNTEYTIL